MDKQQLLNKLEKEWTAFNASYADLSEARLTEHLVKSINGLLKERAVLLVPFIVAQV